MILTLQANTKYLFFLWFSVFGFLRLFVHYWMHTRTGRGLFLFVWIQQMQNSEFHYRLQWFISFFAYFSLIWNIGSDIVFFAGTLRLTCQHHTIKSIAKKIYYDVHEQKMMKVFKKTQSNERCIRLALFKSAQDDKDRIGSQTRR